MDDDASAAQEAQLTIPPVLSTPAEHLFEHVEPTATPCPTKSAATSESLDNVLDNLATVYETTRTSRDIRDGGWSRVALQFPDTMLGDAPRVVELLKKELDTNHGGEQGRERQTEQTTSWPGKIYILADTSYSACCVDEIAAEHVDAQVVVHYGRSCLSPTARLPVLYVFTHQQLDVRLAANAVEKELPDNSANIILMADITYQIHVPAVFTELQHRGYTNIRSTEIVHDPSAPIPNRSIVQPASPDATSIPPGAAPPDLQDSAIFHISAPPTSLLLSLSSKVQSMHIYHTSRNTDHDHRPAISALLSRRYAKVLSLATAGVIGILVNTLSIANYLSSVDSIRNRIAAAGKKSYTIVVGKLNPAKLANFAEIEGWVVVGCWESSLVEEDENYYRPVITPFELEVALMRDDERVWGEKWWGGIEGTTDSPESSTVQKVDGDGRLDGHNERDEHVAYTFDQEIDDEESEPPEFDLRTGRLVSHSRPMQAKPRRTNGVNESEKSASNGQDGTTALALQPKAELATINGVVSPGAEFLRSQRQWQGLGSDFDGQERSSAVEEGRSGIARGYNVGEEADRR